MGNDWLQRPRVGTDRAGGRGIEFALNVVVIADPSGVSGAGEGVFKMELHQLEAFVAVGHERSFSRAARLLHITRPAISRRIKRLEDELNVTLLRRESRTVSLTLAGCRFFLDAQHILSLCARSIENARQKKSSNDDASSGNAVVH